MLYCCHCCAPMFRQLILRRQQPGLRASGGACRASKQRLAVAWVGGGGWAWAPRPVAPACASMYGGGHGPLHVHPPACAPARCASPRTPPTHTRTHVRTPTPRPALPCRATQQGQKQHAPKKPPAKCRGGRRGSLMQSQTSKHSRQHSIHSILIHSIQSMPHRGGQGTHAPAWVPARWGTRPRSSL